MKALKSIMLGLAMLVACTVSNAKSIPSTENMTAVHAINTYVDAMTRGRMQGLKEVLDPSAKFSMLRGKQMLCFDKNEMISFLNQTKNIEQACTTSTSVVESNADVAVIKVDMKFANFTRSNYLTVANTGKGWKITSVHSVFKS